MNGIVKEREKVRAAKAPTRKRAASVAGDLMDPACARLRTSQSLGDALEKLRRNGASALPVVDEDDCLVGSFGSADVLRLCVPEHLLWADELPQSHDVETLAITLRGEVRRPLSELMLVGGQLLTVSESTPLAKVARMMAKHEADRALVVERRRLRGTVTAGDLCSSMLGKQIETGGRP